MALGIYDGAGSVRNVKELYVGAGGVKTVKEVYVGIDGSPRKVWPPYTDYGDVYNLATNDGILNVYSCENNSRVTGGEISSTYARTPNFNIMTSSNSPNTSGSYWSRFETVKLDTRGYNYVLVHYLVQGARNTTGYQRPFASWGTTHGYTWSTYVNNGHLVWGSTAGCNIRTDPTDESSYGIYILLDISSVKQEDIYLQIGAALCWTSESSLSCSLITSEIDLCKSKPSTSVSQTITLSA